jgi:DNA uptake protein ComE-like DNA-binding protein
MSLELSPQAVARLNDKKWRRGKSKWMLWIYLTQSMFGVIGFALLAIKTKDATLKKYAYILSTLIFLVFLLIGLDDEQTKTVDGETVTEYGTLGNIALLVLLCNYGLQVGLSFKANKIWLLHQAQYRSQSWVNENFPNTSSVSQPLDSRQEQVIEDLGINTDDYIATTPTPIRVSEKQIPPPPSKKINQQSNAVVNLNSASVEDLINLVGFDPVLAANTVVQREKVKSFGSFEEFANALELQPHQIVKFKPLLSFPKIDRPASALGRVLDI